MAQFSVDVSARTQRFAQEMAKLPGITEQEVAKAAAKLATGLEKAEARAALAAQRQASKAAQRTAEAAAAQRRINFSVTAGDLMRVAQGAANLAQHLADANNRLSDTSARTGVAVETIKGMDLAFQGAGLSTANVESILNRFPKVLGDMARGTGEAAPAFERLGLKAEDAGAMLKDTDGGLKEILKRLAQVPDTGERASLAMQIFGRQGGQILQSGLLDSSAALETFIGHADRWGLDTGPEAAKQAARFQRATAELKTVLEGLGSQLADSMGTDSASLVEDFTRTMVEATEIVKLTGAGAVLSLIAMKDAVVALAGGGGVEGAREVFQAFEADLQRMTDASYESLRSFYDGRDAIAELGGAAKDTSTAEEDAAEKAKRLAAAQKAAAEAARAHATELRAVEGELQRIVSANEDFLRGDSIEANRDKALDALEVFAQRSRDVGLEQEQVEQEIALRRLAIWEEYYSAREKADQESVAEALKLRADYQERAREAAAEEVRLAEEVAAARRAGAREALDNATALVDGLIGLAEMNAEAQGRSEEEIAQMRKRAALFGAIVSTAQGVATALGTSPPPLNFINAGLVAAAGAVQVATIEGSQFHRGRAARGMAADERPAVVQDTEAILDTRMTQQLRTLLAEGGGGGKVTTIFRLGTKTLSAQTAAATRQPGPVRREILGKSKPWRRR